MMETAILITADTPLEDVIALGEAHIKRRILYLENTDCWTDLDRAAMAKLQAAMVKIRRTAND